jgi:hypothetical protein
MVLRYQRFYVLLSLLHIIVVASNDRVKIAEYSVVQCCANQSSVFTVQFYQIFKHTRRLIMDNETVNTLGFKPENDVPLWNISQLERYALKQPSVPLLRAASTGDSFDNIKINFIQRARAPFPERILFDIKIICYLCKNPTIVPWHHQMLGLSELAWQTKFYQSFWWMNQTGDSYSLHNPSLFGISTKESQSISGSSEKLLRGTDCRMIINERTQHLFVVCFDYGGLSKLSYFVELYPENVENTTTNLLRLASSSPQILTPDQKSHTDQESTTNLWEKNWFVPSFIFNLSKPNDIFNGLLLN